MFVPRKITNAWQLHAMPIVYIYIYGEVKYKIYWLSCDMMVYFTFSCNNIKVTSIFRVTIFSSSFYQAKEITYLSTNSALRTVYQMFNVPIQLHWYFFFYNSLIPLEKRKWFLYISGKYSRQIIAFLLKINWYPSNFINGLLSFRRRHHWNVYPQKTVRAWAVWCVKDM